MMGAVETTGTIMSQGVTTRQLLDSAASLATMILDDACASTA